MALKTTMSKLEDSKCSFHKDAKLLFKLLSVRFLYLDLQVRSLLINSRSSFLIFQVSVSGKHN